MNLRALSIVLTCYLVQASADHSAQRWPQGSSYDKVERSALDAFLIGNEGPSPGRVHSDAREAMSLGYLGGNGDFGGDAPIHPSSVRQRDEVPTYRRRYMDFLQERKVFQYYRDAEELQRVRGLATNENGDYSDIMFEYPSDVKEPLENKVETKEANDEVVKDKKQEVAKDDAKTSKQEKVQDETKITKGPEEPLSSEDETNPTNSKDESKEKAADPAQEEKKGDENKHEIIVETESQVVEVEKVKAVAMEVEDPRGVMKKENIPFKEDNNDNTNLDEVDEELNDTTKRRFQYQSLMDDKPDINYRRDSNVEGSDGVQNYDNLFSDEYNDETTGNYGNIFSDKEI